MPLQLHSRLNQEDQKFKTKPTCTTEPLEGQLHETLSQNKQYKKGWSYCCVIEYLPRKALGLIPNTVQKTNQSYPHGLEGGGLPIQIHPSIFCFLMGQSPEVSCHLWPGHPHCPISVTFHCYEKTSDRKPLRGSWAYFGSGLEGKASSLEAERGQFTGAELDRNTPRLTPMTYFLQQGKGSTTFPSTSPWRISHTQTTTPTVAW